MAVTWEMPAAKFEARRPGGGRKRAAGPGPGLRPALLALVEPEERGDPLGCRARLCRLLVQKSAPPTRFLRPAPPWKGGDDDQSEAAASSFTATWRFWVA